MAHQKFVAERRQFILDEMRKHGRVTVHDLSEKLNVSTVTIRADLRALEKHGLLERTYGGAILAQVGGTIDEMAFDVRQASQQAEKRAIGQVAAHLVEDGFAIALDSSSTASMLVPHLREREELTIVTNSLIIAQQFADRPQITVLMPGGQLRGRSIALVGRPETLPEIHLNVGFFGTRGISPQVGFTDINLDEVEMKRALRERCLQTVIVADSSKWGQVAPYPFVSSEDVDFLVTAGDIPAEMAAAFARLGVHVQRADQ